MGIGTKILQIRNTPFKIVVNKFISKYVNRIKDRAQKKEDLAISTYTKYFQENIDFLNLINFERNFDDSEINILNNYTKQIIGHRFDLLGSGLKCYNKELNFLNVPESCKNDSQKIISLIPTDYHFIDWQKDFKNDYKWENDKWYKEISYKNQNADIKLPWEIGRLQHFPALVLNFKITKDEKYLLEFKNQLLDFIANNPPRFGVQWKTSMDIAFRAVNILVAIDLLGDKYQDLPDEVRLIIQNYLFEHGNHIFQNLEWSAGQRGNHYLANLVGLIFISIYFGDKANKKWIEFALPEFFNEIEYQFNNDGSNFEASTSYHFLGLEMILWSFKIVNSFLETYSDDYAKHVKKLLQKSWDKYNKLSEKFLNIQKFTNSILVDNFEHFVIGDSDGGYLINLPLFNFKSITDLKFNFNRSILCSMLDDFIKNTLNQKVNEIAKSQVVEFNDFGLYCFENYNYKALFRCGSLGQNGKGGHAHCDQLSLYLSYKNYPILIDAGTLVYTSDHLLRNKFRSSSYHNTLVIDGFEQETLNNDFDSLFWLGNKSKAEILEIKTSLVKAHHHGYPVVHTRLVEFTNREILIKDICHRKDKKIQFIIPMEYKIELSDEEVILFNDDFKIKFISNNHTWCCEDIIIAKSYGIERMARKLYIKSEEFEINWKIVLL